MKPMKQFTLIALCAVFTPLAPAQDGPYKLDRTKLPIAEPDYPHSTVLDARDTKPPPRFEVKAPAGAPNVLIVLIDDMGFGQSSAFGGPIHMPTVEALANDGMEGRNTGSPAHKRAAEYVAAQFEKAVELVEAGAGRPAVRRS